MTKGTSIPLYQRGSRSSSVASKKTLLSHTRTLSTQEQITPPPTPRSGREPSVKSHSRVEHDGCSVASRAGPFPVFMRAFYAFRASPNPESSTVTLPLCIGDIVMIHNIHVNGWADGTTLLSGSRGWLPTNFCESYEMDQMQPLLKSGINLFEECRGAATAGFVNTSQEVVGEVVNGVRYLLESTDCLTRDSPNVQSDDSIRKTRKILLSELSVLVKTARRVPEQFTGQGFSSIAEDLMDEMILSSFRVILCGVKFLDFWCEIHEPLDDQILDEDTTIVDEITDDSCTQSTATHSESNQDLESVNTSMYSREMMDLQPSEPTGFVRDRAHGLTIITSQYLPAHEPTSFLALTPASTIKGSECPTPDYPKDEVMKQSVPTVSSQQVFALARLNFTYDALLSCLATYIGSIHLKAPLPSRLLDLTKEAVESAKDFIEVVDHIRNHGNGSKSLESHKMDMSGYMNALIAVAQSSVKPLNQNEEEVSLTLVECQPLIDAATKCVQGASECVEVAHNIIDCVGDFQITLNVSATSVSEIGVGITTISADLFKNDSINTNIQIASEHKPSSVVTMLNLDSLLPVIPDMSSPLLPIQPMSPLVSTSPETVVEEGSEKTDSALQAVAVVPKSFSLRREESMDSDLTEESKTSTRATTPIEQTPVASPKFTMLANVIIPPAEFTSDSIPPTPMEERGNPMLERSHLDRLIFNKDGAITGGSLPALIERMTMPDSTPDVIFVNAFFLTFRQFTTPLLLAQTLLDRFEEVSGNLRGSTPARLRVYNVFKQWLETHWKQDLDTEALTLIRDFAMIKLRPVLPTSADRLHELTDKVNHISADCSLVPREAVTLQKSRSAIALDQLGNAPEPRMTKSQLNLLKQYVLHGGNSPSILDFDPWEIARQFTLKESRLFCSIAPHELLAKEWQKKENSKAVNVRAMSSLSTDLTNMVAITILHEGDAKKRALVIKQWVKVADKCLELANYNSLMAIVCSLNASTIVRLKKTWELVSPRTKAALDKLRVVIEISKNYSEYRARLRSHVPPCLPFLGIYLTDLTFVDDGNPDKRHFPDDDANCPTAINFDKYTKIARMLMELQRFQVPYKIQEVPEMQQWIDTQITRVRESEIKDVQMLYRRSLALEPREPKTPAAIVKLDTVVPSAMLSPTVSLNVPEKSGFLGWAHSIKEKSSLTSFNLASSSS